MVLLAAQLRSMNHSQACPGVCRSERNCSEHAEHTGRPLNAKGHHRAGASASIRTKTYRTCCTAVMLAPQSSSDGGIAIHCIIPVVKADVKFQAHVSPALSSLGHSGQVKLLRQAQYGFAIASSFARNASTSA